MSSLGIALFTFNRVSTILSEERASLTSQVPVVLGLTGSSTFVIGVTPDDLMSDTTSRSKLIDSVHDARAISVLQRGDSLTVVAKSRNVADSVIERCAIQPVIFLGAHDGSISDDINTPLPTRSLDCNAIKSFVEER